MLKTSSCYKRHLLSSVLQTHFNCSKDRRSVSTLVSIERQSLLLTVYSSLRTFIKSSCSWKAISLLWKKKTRGKTIRCIQQIGKLTPLKASYCQLYSSSWILKLFLWDQIKKRNPIMQFLFCRYRPSCRIPTVNTTATCFNWLKVLSIRSAIIVWFSTDAHRADLGPVRMLSSDQIYLTCDPKCQKVLTQGYKPEHCIHQPVAIIRYQILPSYIWAQLKFHRPHARHIILLLHLNVRDPPPPKCVNSISHAMRLTE